MTVSTPMQDHAGRTTLPAVLTVAGSDSSGGAGIQADLKTMLANGVFGMSAITALTAQNTMGVTGVENVSPEMVAAQIDAVFADIPPQAVKIGMVSSAPLIEAIADRLAAHHATNVVLDPVMVATSGARLIDNDAIDALTSRLFPLATVITPNIPETEVLLELGGGQAAADDAVAQHAAEWTGDAASETGSATIAGPAAMETAGRAIERRYGCAVLVKGGHGVADASDLLVSGGATTWFHGTRVDNPNTHGTGCTLSSAIASNLAKGETLEGAIRLAKVYLTGALEAQLDLGHGSGPMDHAWRWR
nr:hydroxymethylpyrimidine/phosphomethylpyrimidine kinase [Bifidobacterium leontopitheci]